MDKMDTITCAMKATKIWDVLNVATVEGGIIVRDLVVQKNPNKPKNIRNEWFCHVNN